MIKLQVVSEWNMGDLLYRTYGYARTVLLEIQAWPERRQQKAYNLIMDFAESFSHGVPEDALNCYIAGDLLDDLQEIEEQEAVEA